MNTRNIRKIGLMALVGALIGLSGCATTDQVDNLQAQIDSLKSMKADVAAASSEAASVSAKADDAIETSNIAVGVANEANRRSIETESKIDRMFKKAMHK